MGVLEIEVFEKGSDGYLSSSPAQRLDSFSKRAPEITASILEVASTVQHQLEAETSTTPARLVSGTSTRSIFPSSSHWKPRRGWSSPAPRRQQRSAWRSVGNEMRPADKLSSNRRSTTFSASLACCGQRRPPLASPTTVGCSAYEFEHLEPLLLDPTIRSFSAARISRPTA